MSNEQWDNIISSIKQDNVNNLDEHIKSGLCIDSKIPCDRLDIPQYCSFCPPLVSFAAYIGSVGCFEYLLNKGAKAGLLDGFRTPLSYFAAASGIPKILICTQSRGISFVGAEFIAIEHQQLKTLEWMQEKRILKTQIIDPQGFSPMMCAILTENIDILTFLTNKAFCSVSNDVSGTKLLHFSIRMEKYNSALFLINHNRSDVNELDKNIFA